MLEFKKAVFAVLNADATLLALTSIHDNAKLDEALPFIDLANISERDWSTKSYTGSEYFPTIHVWAATSNLVIQIAERIRILLHRQDLTVPGQNFVEMIHEDTDIFIDSDETTLHGIVSFRALLHG